MAKIGEVKIEGLGGGNKVFNRRLDPQINVVFGKNGGGKTTLLKTLYSALRNDASMIADSTVRVASVEIESHTYEEIYVRVLAKTSETQASRNELLALNDLEGLKPPDRRSTMTWQTQADLKNPNAAFQSVYLSVSRLYNEALRQAGRNYILGGWQSTPSDEDPVTREPSMEAMFAASFTRKWSTYSNRLLAEIKRIQQDGIGSILQAVLLTNSEPQVPQGDPEKAYDLAKSFFERQPELSSLVKSKTQFKNHYQGNPSLRAVMRNIEAVEKNIAEALKQRTSLSDALNKLFEGKTLRLTDTGIEIEADGISLNMAQLSTGEKQLLSLCVEVLSLDGPAALIIDEPEMSLHVDWQKDLLHTLAVLNPSAQIIVATHSPEIMANIDDKCVFRI